MTLTTTEERGHPSGPGGVPPTPHYPALDGLRGVAVLAVLLYHGGAAAVTGGFLGVDLFFVLSGFLITGLLLAEWDARSQLGLRQFWYRRARRLLPALFLVLAATAVVAALLDADVSRQVRGDGLASLLYVSNWWFISQGMAYDTALADPSPLQHTWSLAIEEQWYLLLPLAFVVALPLVRSRFRLGLVLLLLAGGSTALMFALAPPPGTDPSRVYFGTDTRVAALLVGGALACVAPALGQRRAISWAALGSAILLGAAFVTLSFQNPWLYRGGFLLVAVAAAAVIADVVNRPDGILGRALSVRPLVLVGLVSYGLYLWHWPVYVFLTPDRVGVDGWPLLVLRLAVTSLLAVASYRLVERPIRRGGLQTLPTPFRRGLIIGVPVVVVAVLLLAPLVARPAARDALTTLASATQRAIPPGRADAPRVVILGDSQALAVADLYPPEETALNPVPAVRFGCGLVPYEADIAGQRMTIPEECPSWTQDYRDVLREAHADLGVLLVGSWEQYDRWTPDGAITFRDPRWRSLLTAAYGERLQELHRTTGRVVVVLNHCHGTAAIDAPLQTQYTAGRYPPVVNDPARIAAVNRAAAAAARHQDFPVTVLDPNPVLCPDGFQESIDGVELRTDGLHLSEGGAAVLWKWLAPRLQHRLGRHDSAS